MKERHPFERRGTRSTCAAGEADLPDAFFREVYRREDKPPLTRLTNRPRNAINLVGRRLIRLDFMPANSANGFWAGFGNEGMNGRSGLVTSPGAALVTGAASGIGRKIAACLALARYSVVVHCSLASRDNAEAAAASIKEQGGKAGVLAADLREPGALAHLAADAAAIFGPLTLLINNAAVFEADDVASFDLERWEKHFSVNLRAPLVLSRDFAGQLPDGTEGAIVNIIDQRVLRPTPQFFTYSLSKSALWAATRTMAQAFAPKGIRVNAVGPGPVSPNLIQGEAGFAREVRGLPLGRAISPGDVAGAVLYLAAARNVTGQLIAVDAGQHLAWRTADIVL
jgi:NAD(P)-dependent dehydrogenase (short-subunit alcohol dehydrogenase family)